MTAQELLEVRFSRASTDEEIDHVRRCWQTLRDVTRQWTPRPFLVITPLGMPRRETIARALAGENIAISSRTSISDWPAASTLVYARTDDDERLRVALAFERLWRGISLSQEAERWDLNAAGDLPKLIEVKPRLHSGLGTVCFRVSIPDVTLRTPGQIVRMKAVHVPDLDRFEAESQILDAFVARANH